MQRKDPLAGGKLHVVEIIRSRAGEADDLDSVLDEIAPGMIALDLTPDQLQQTIAHVKHGVGIEVSRLDEAWTNCLAAFQQVDVYGTYVEACEYALDQEIPLVALDRDGSDLRKGQKRRLASSLSDDPIEAEDAREIAMAFRTRMHELNLIDTIEARETSMAETLADVLGRGSRVAAVMSYPSSEEILIRVRSRLEDEAETPPG